jgi:acetone monooxygenase
MTEILDRPVSGADAQSETKQYDAIVVGAGSLGLYQLHKLREQGLSVRAFEEGAGVGGTWHWNRYPGARFDSDTETYAYTFTPELAKRWTWSERFAAQPEIERYFNFVADELGLKQHINFKVRVTRAQWNSAESLWTLQLSDGRQVRATWVVMAVGILSADYRPPFEGAADFEGVSFHSSRWPEGFSVAGKRVAVIGTGSTGVQIIENIGSEVESLTVYQRTPNYVVPLRNAPLTADEQEYARESAAEIQEHCRATPFGFKYVFEPGAAMSLPLEERRKWYEEVWSRPGFGKWLSGFSDVMADPEANEEWSEFVREKIRQRVGNPELAKKLVPTDHPFGSKRVPMETKFFEVFAQPNVELVDVNENPIQRVTKNGIETLDGAREFDVIVYATGFDSITGAVTNIDIVGLNGETVKKHWQEGVRTNLLVQTHGFPNLFIGTASSFCNYTVCAQILVEWIADCISYLRKKGHNVIEATHQAEEEWVEHAEALASQTILVKAKSSWFTGTNIPGKARRNLLYANSVPEYSRLLRESAENDYAGFDVR